MSRPLFPNSATLRVDERLVLAGGDRRRVDLCVRYGLWDRPGKPPILIDTGYTARSCSAPDRSWMLKAYGRVLAPQLRQDGQMARRLADFGHSCDDVELAVLTHFHADHVAGVRDLPRARFLVSQREWKEIKGEGAIARTRRGVFRELFPNDFGSRLAFVEDLPQVRLPSGLGVGGDVLGDGSLLTVPLPGHSSGHFGLLWPRLPRPLLYAVDVQWLWRAVEENRPPATTRLVFHDQAAMLAAMEAVRRFAAAGGEVVLCHDPAPEPGESA